jgi:FKBP-type peptidyl-prolyl cis-trans isomerase (trigger factor)
MKISFAAILGTTLVSQALAFAPNGKSAFRLSPLNLHYELKAEPEGGEELTPIASMAGSRMKNMGVDAGTKSEDGSDVYTFWLTADADGKLIKEYRTTVEKDAAKKANFPGFRKGQVPPYAQPQMTMFAIQEAVIKTCESAVAAYGLKSLPGSDGSVEVFEDIKDITKGYKIGSDVTFTASFKASFDAEARKNEEQSTAEGDTVVAEE